MPKSALQKEKRRVKRRAAKARKAAVRNVVAQKVLGGGAIGGGGRYKSLPLRRKLGGAGSYSISDIANAVSGVANYSPSTAVGGLAQKGASALAADLGVPKGIANALGNAASWATKLFGFGNYSTYKHTDLKKNSLLGMTDESGFMTNAPISFTGNKGPTVRIQHDEFIQDIEGTEDFTKITLALNPGNPILMPWGSQLARLYEEFKWHGLVMEYRPNAALATSSTNLGLGVVIEATDYDPYDDIFIDKKSMENAMFASSGNPTKTIFHPVECAPKMNATNQQFVQPGLTASDEAPGDQRFSILGNYSIATVGQNIEEGSNAKMGELWIHYDVELSRPILTLASSSFSQHVSATYAGGTITFTGNTNPATGFSVSQSDDTTHCIHLTKSISVPSAAYLLTVVTKMNSDTVSYASVPIVEVGTSEGGSLPTLPLLVTNAAGATNSLVLFNSGAPFAATPNPIRSSVSAMIAEFDETGQYFIVNLPAGSTGSNYCDIFITEWNSAYNAKREKAWKRMNSTVYGNVSKLEEEVARLARLIKDSRIGEASQVAIDLATHNSGNAVVKSTIVRDKSLDDLQVVYSGDASLDVHDEGSSSGLSRYVKSSPYAKQALNPKDEGQPLRDGHTRK